MSTDPLIVLHHHLAAFGAGDVDEIVADYTEDAVLITANGVTRGVDALRTAFSGFFAGLFAPGTYEFALDSERVEGEVAHITWHATCSTTEIPLGTDTFVIRDGKIVAQTFSAQMVPR